MEQIPPFSMPMFRDWMPERIRPWIYVFIVCCFQLSAGRYLGPLNEIMGEHDYMREDMVMCMHATLAGMAIWFPMLFRMKFRFTNKTLLLTAATTVIVCNLLSMYVTCLPLLWAICFVSGIAKIQGTFECISNIQLWMTSTRDMRIFFPILHLFILSAICAQTLLSAWFGQLGCWELMHWLIIGLQLIVLLIIIICTRHFRFAKESIRTVDWPSFVLWAILLMQLAYFFDYGEFYNWFHQPTMWYLAGSILINIALIIKRMSANEHAFIGARVFTGFKHVNHLLVLVLLCEMVLAAERVLEEILKEEVLGYDTITGASTTWLVWAGNLLGCAFSFFFMRYVKRYTYIRLGEIGTVSILIYLIIMYFRVMPGLNIEALYLPFLIRGFATGCLSIMFLTALHDLMNFEYYFQGLSVCNMLHMMIGGAIGCAIYNHAIKWSVADAMARNGQFISDLTVAIKPIYGVAIYVCIAILAIFMLFDSPLRRDNKRPYLFWEHRLKKGVAEEE